MRVVAGEAKGRRLTAPPGGDTRPTSDRVREAVFSMVESRLTLAGATVLDLFAGSGALGIEALSRGAARATFVERAPAAVAAVRRNLEVTGLAGRAEVVAADVLRWLDGDRHGAPPGPVDVAFADPPYAFTAWPDVAARLTAGLFVVESGDEVELGEGWVVRTVRRYGSTVVTLATPSGKAGS